MSLPPPPPPDPWPSKPAGHLEPLPTVIPRPAKRNVTPILLIIATVLVVAALIAGLVFWLMGRASDGAGSTAITTTAKPTTPTTTTPSQADYQTRLTGLLPPGYSPSACKPVALPPGATAVLSCEKNSDPGGPLSATYTLLRDKAAVQTAFDDVLRGMAVEVCPGNIQSPGPWRRNATPQTVSGTLVCGMRDKDRPTVAWTTDDSLLLSVVDGDPAGPNIEELYGWWSSHS